MRIKKNKLNTHIDNKDNPHDITKSHVGLSNVENKSSEDIRKEITSTNIEDALGFLPYSPKHIDDMFSEFEINSGGNGIYCSTTEPNEAANGMLWIDESENPENVDEETSDNHQDE